MNKENLMATLENYIPKVAGALIALIVGLIVIAWLTRLIKKMMVKRDIDASVRPFLASLVNVGLKVMLLLAVARMFGVETTSFIAVFSALAFAIGMALQGSLGHFASGVMVLLFKPFKVGDLVDLNGKIGVVEEIMIFNTVLRTPDNKKIIIPNGIITSNPITNVSGQGEIRVDMTFGIGYDDDIDKARSVIQAVADACPEILKDKPVDILVSELADSSVNFAVRPWCKSEHYWDVFFYMNEHVKKQLDGHGISIPYPQVEMHNK